MVMYPPLSNPIEDKTPFLSGEKFAEGIEAGVVQVDRMKISGVPVWASVVIHPRYRIPLFNSQDFWMKSISLY